MPKIDLKMTPKAIKKWIFIGVVLIVLLFVLFRSQRDTAFRIAKKAFNEQDYMHAAELFSELGAYSNSDSYVIFCQAMQLFTDGEYESALPLYEQLDTFERSNKYLIYSQAMIAYENMDYWRAAGLFEECGDNLFGHTDFLDSDLRAKLCYYNTGTILEASGDFTRAIICYRLADDFEDAQVRLTECQRMLSGT